jgi:hypothetical protein
MGICHAAVLQSNQRSLVESSFLNIMVDIAFHISFDLFFPSGITWIKRTANTTLSTRFAGFFALAYCGFSIAAPAGFYPLGTINLIDTTNVILGNPSAEAVPTILIANLPQIGLSLSYLFFNHFYTSLLVAREWSQYGQEKKGLRVSQNPIGSQEKTRFLSLPGLYSACLMITSALLHWLLSQSFFLIYINVFDANGMPDPSDSIVVIRYSMVGLLALMLVLLIINFTTFMLGVFKRFPEGMPPVGTCSAGISAGCHPLQEGDISGKSVS